jgi:hypothetical protein
MFYFSFPLGLKRYNFLGQTVVKEEIIIFQLFMTPSKVEEEGLLQAEYFFFLFQ